MFQLHRKVHTESNESLVINYHNYICDIFFIIL